MTVAAYQAAIAWAGRTGRPLGLECDVHFSADDELICLHDLHVDRTSAHRGLAFERTVDELRQIDFGSWKIVDPEPEQQRLITLRELLVLVRDARTDGVEVTLAIETKHPNPRGAAVEERVATLLEEFCWDKAGSPVRVISFSLDAVITMGELLPEIERTMLVEVDLGPWKDGHLPRGVSAVGPDLCLVKRDPAFVERAHAHGNEVHVWTVNRPEDIQLCIFLGVDGFTTDYPERVAEALDMFVMEWPRH